MEKDTTINVVLEDINYIPSYKAAEEQRRSNEDTRISNENKRISNEQERIKFQEERETKLNEVYDKFNNSLDEVKEELKEKLEEETAKEVTNEIKKEISSLVDNSPLVANSIDEMTDTSRVYVNTTDGNWYYYNGTSWISGGVYQSAGISDASITPEKTTFIATDNILYYYQPVKQYCLTKANDSDDYSIDKYYTRYLSIVPVEPNNDYSFFYKTILENGANYFKMCTSSKTVAEIMEYMKSNSKLSLDGTIYSTTNVINNFTTGANDKSLIIQFTNDTQPDYAELIKGTRPAQKYTSYNDCLSVLGFSAYNKEEIDNKINDIGIVSENGVVEYCKDEYFEVGGILATGQPYAENYYKRTKGFISERIKFVEIITNDENYNLMICRYDDNGNIVDRIVPIKSYTFDHNNYKYRVVVYNSFAKPDMNNIDVSNIVSLYNTKLQTTTNNIYSLTNNELTIKTKKALYIFKKVTDTSINVDVWRLYKGDLLDSNGNVVGNMWLNSDAEGAIRMNGEADFVSGYHGDEIMTDLKIIVDGIIIDNNSTIEERIFNNITIVCKSDVYHCNTSNLASTKAFERIKKLVFKGNKVTVSNDYVVKDTNGLSIARAATLLFQCFKRDNNSNLMLNYVNSSDDIELYPITTSACDTPSLETENSEVYYYTKYGVIRQKMLKGLNVGTFNPFVEDYTSQGALRLKTYWCYDNFNVALNDRLLSEFEWEIE